MPLTVTEIKNAKPREKTYRLHDGGGMYLEIFPAGGKYWRLKYRHQGKEKRLALGVFPEVSLADAREKRSAARKMIALGEDPADTRKSDKKSATEAAATFESVAKDWHKRQCTGWTASHANTVLDRLEKNAFPWIGSTPVSSIEAPAILALLRRIEERGALETAHRVRGVIGQVMRYAIACGLAMRDPAADLRGALPPTKKSHHASVTDPQDIGPLLRSLHSYKGTFVVRCALRLAPLVFTRPGELRHAEWSEIDFDAAEWRIPAEKMKVERPHIVPLSRQAVAILREVQPLTGSGRYVFPSMRSSTRPMSENTVTAALRRMGYSKDEMTGHGFRSMASTRLHELGWTPDAIERQLAHVEGNKVKAAYNYAEHLAERRHMMQAWADYLDGLRGEL